MVNKSKYQFVKNKIDGKSINELLNCKDSAGYFVSYNPNVNNDPFVNLITDIGHIIGGLSKRRNIKETALVRPQKSGINKYLILNGDFRKEYLKVAGNWEKSLAVYKKLSKKHKSDWGDKL